MIQSYGHRRPINQLHIAPMLPIAKRFQTPFNRNPQGGGGATSQIYYNQLRLTGKMPVRKGLR